MSLTRRIGVLILVTLLISSCATKKIANSNTASEKAKHIEYVLNSLKTKHLDRFIKEWIGTPYKIGGLDKKGIDCSGFTQLLQKEVFHVDLKRRSMDQATQIVDRKLDNLKEGDLIFFSFNKKEIDHVGVYLRDNWFVHASISRGVIVDDLNLKAYQEAFIKSGFIKK